MVIIEKNWYRIFPPQALLWGILLVPILTLFLVFALGAFVLPSFNRIQPKELAAILGISLAVAALLTWLFPPPLPAIPRQHTLRLVATGEKNTGSKGTEVEIEAIRAIDGTPLPINQAITTGDWKLDGSRLVSSGSEPGAAAELSVDIPSGVELRLVFGRKSGKLLIQLDQSRQEMDLYSPWTTRGSLPITLPAWAGFSPLQKSLVAFGGLLYFLAIASLIFLAGLAFHLHLLPAWAGQAIIVSACLVALFFYVGLKRSYANFNAERVYGDTITYVATAQEPLLSTAFWISKRTFTLPLLYKFAGLNYTNYTNMDVMRRVGNDQVWISIFAWTVLAGAVASTLHHRWLRPAAFALVLFFSLSLDITLWDRLMYSESVSFSLFALLIACWIGIEKVPQKPRTPFVSYLYLFGLIVISVLFSFTRDTNLYLLVIGAVIFALAALFNLVAPAHKKLYFLYLVAMVGLFFYQNMTIRLGDRWQIHVFDNLARRVLLDPQALAYFEQAGLPVNDKVRDLAGMGVFEYQSRLETSEEPEYQAVRDWVNQSGQSTYIRYLLSHPDKSLLEPARNIAQLLNGSNREYRFPIFPGQPVPEQIDTLDRKLYYRSWLAVIASLSLVIAGLVLYVSGRWRHHPSWLVWGVLVLSLLPVSFIVWNGNPLEIERHASLLGIQLRLAGWGALLLVIDTMILNALRSNIASPS